MDLPIEIVLAYFVRLYKTKIAPKGLSQRQVYFYCVEYNHKCMGFKCCVKLFINAQFLY